jgi:uncharacterized caspase-like protein
LNIGRIGGFTVLHGVVIGIDKYSDPNIPNLRSARADAEAISAALRDGIALRERSVETILDTRATRAAIMKAVGEALPRRQRPEDLVVIYFAGHGSPEQESPPDRISRYLVEKDSRHGRLPKQLALIG